MLAAQRLSGNIYVLWIYDYVMMYVRWLLLTYGSQHVVYVWLVFLDVMGTNQFGEVVQKFLDTGHDDATTGDGRELLKMMLCAKQE